MCDRLAGFNEAPVIADNARNKGSRKHLKAIYYDTADQILRKNGLSLRVRQSGQRFVQTMKAEDGDDPLRRGEWEASVASFTPDVGLAMPFVPAKLREALTAQPLRAGLHFRYPPAPAPVDLPAGTIEVAFDRGLLKAGERSMPVSEIELELKEGSPSVDLRGGAGAGRPRRGAPVDPQQGGARLRPGEPTRRRRPRRRASSTSTHPCRSTRPSPPFSHRACAICWCRCRRPRTAAIRRASIRSAWRSRRLRSALDSMATLVTSETLEVLRADASWLASTLSAARTWDIFQERDAGGRRRQLPGRRRVRCARRRRGGATACGLRRCPPGALRQPQLPAFVIRLGGWVEARGWRSDVGPEHLPLLAEPAFSFAQRILSVHHDKVLKRGRHFKSLTAPERHRLRLAVKKLRYVADFLLPLCTDRKSARQFTSRLADLQEELGAFNDMTTTGIAAGRPGGGIGRERRGGRGDRRLAGPRHGRCRGPAEERLAGFRQDATALGPAGSAVNRRNRPVARPIWNIS